jgi:kynureninase
VITASAKGAWEDASAREEALARDAADPLRAFAAEFLVPRDTRGRTLIYLCGHSLGLQPKAAAAYVGQELGDWARLGVQGHFHAERPWVDYHERLSVPLAELVGAIPSEVVAMNSLTVNLHLMLVSFFRPVAGRDCILIERAAFPSDRYAVASQLRFHGLDPAAHLIEVSPRSGEASLRTEDLLQRLDACADRLALVLLPGVQYLSGEALDLDPLITRARALNIPVGLDLAHAIGNLPLRLHDWNADFAVWCSYKYLNAGPGAIGGCFVHERHAQDRSRPRFAGWWGHDKTLRFAMGPDFEAIAGAEGWQLSNPPILSTAPLLASCDLFMRAGLPRLREKSIALTAYFERCLRAAVPARIAIVTPSDPAARGCQLSLRLLLPTARAKRCALRLEAAGIVGDWREPDILRLAPTPLYNSFIEAYCAAAALADALAAEAEGSHA